MISPIALRIFSSTNNFKWQESGRIGGVNLHLTSSSSATVYFHFVAVFVDLKLEYLHFGRYLIQDLYGLEILAMGRIFIFLFPF